MVSARLCLCSLFSVALGATVPFASKSNVSSVQWGECNNSIITNPEISCAIFEVPLDYHNASVGTAQLALAKINATVEPRLGSVFFNPGGPGGSGLEAIEGFAQSLVNITGGHYDMVTWDPRGVGFSSPGDIQCFDTLEAYQEVFNGTVQVNGIEMTGNFTDPEDLELLFSQADALQKKYEETFQRCIERNGDTLKYVGTAATVRDMVAMADALDGPGEPINYYGVSYGSLLGNFFLNMFPDRVGRVIIDGIVNPHLWIQEEASLTWQQFNMNADDVYTAFATGCALAGPNGCSVSTQAGQTPSEVNDMIQSVLKTAHDATLADPSVPLTSGDVRFQLHAVVANSVPLTWAASISELWPQVTEIVEAESCSKSTAGGRRSISGYPLARRARREMVRRQSTGGNDSPSFATTVIGCSDSTADPNTNTTMRDVFRSLVGAARNISHMFGAVFPDPLHFCSFWPIRAVELYEGNFNSSNLANKILVIGNTYDPLTPFKFAQGVVEDYGDQARLLRFNVFGHTTAAQLASECIFKITNAYMDNGTLPEDNDTVCEANEAFEVFPGVNTQAILAEFPNAGL